MSRGDSSSRSPKSDLASCRSVSLVEQLYFRLSPKHFLAPYLFFTFLHFMVIHVSLKCPYFYFDNAKILLSVREYECNHLESNINNPY